jgi:hypothetical protein
VAKLNPTHIQHKSSDKGTSYSALKAGTTWTAAKKTAAHFDADAKAKPVRRK